MDSWNMVYMTSMMVRHRLMENCRCSSLKKRVTSTRMRRVSVGRYVLVYTDVIKYFLTLKHSRKTAY
jgi:hypothetical protein